jgi:hypothetical protein
VAYNGDPRAPALAWSDEQQKVFLVIRQLGHALVSVRGLHEAEVEITLSEPPVRDPRLDWDPASGQRPVKTPDPPPDPAAPFDPEHFSLWTQAYSVDQGGSAQVDTGELPLPKR